MMPVQALGLQQATAFPLKYELLLGKNQRRADVFMRAGTKTAPRRLLWEGRPTAESPDLKSVKWGFESLSSYQVAGGRSSVPMVFRGSFSRGSSQFYGADFQCGGPHPNFLKSHEKFADALYQKSYSKLLKVRKNPTIFIKNHIKNSRFWTFS